MKIDLTKPLSWKSTDENVLKLLQSLQGNILKGHGRHHTANLFFTLKAGGEHASRHMLRELANFHVTSAYSQLLDAERFKATGKKHKDEKGGGPFVHLALTASGYRVIGESKSMPKDPEFKRGMRHRDSITELKDPALSEWEPDFQKEIHGIVLATDGTNAGTTALAIQLRSLIQAAGGTVFVQQGAALFNNNNEGIEHFGYVDGRSQPLLLVEDIAEERETAGTVRWDPKFPLGTALVRDPGVKGDPTAFGSYFIFRKLEQRVQAFKTREQEVADILKLGTARELAGAMIVGRFEDGTPVTLSDKARNLKPQNDFDYTGDPGIRCPFHAHIRKMNPRGSGLTNKVSQDAEDERSHIMPRRGIPYADKHRAVPPAELPDAKSMEEFKEKVFKKLPKDGVGLLFMAYNADIGRQFKFTQVSWANNRNFPVRPSGLHGIDPVIGQDGLTEALHLASTDQSLPEAWDDESKGFNTGVGFAGFVQLKGGEYFFSPSLTFLRNL